MLRLLKYLFPFIAFSLSTKSNAQKSLVFIGSYCTDTTKEGIYVFELDTINGLLVKKNSINHIRNPSFLQVSDNGKLVYACTDTKTPNAGSVSSFTFNPKTQELYFANKQKSGGENPVYLSVSKSNKWLINGNYTEGSISAFPLNPDSTIAPAAQILMFKDSSINSTRQNRSHIHAVVFSPDENYILCPDLGADKIRVFRFDSSSKQPLKELVEIKTNPGSGPRHLVFHPNGKYVYCIEELSGTISVYSFVNGQLYLLQNIKCYSKKYSKDIMSSDIHISPDGMYLYASNRSMDNTLAIFSIQNNGKLSYVAHQSTFGNHPRMFAIDPGGNFVIVANQISGNIVVFKRNKKTGLLKKIKQTVSINKPSCVQIKQYD